MRVSGVEESQVDTLVFPDRRSSRSLPFSSRRIFRVANGEKEICVDPTKMSGRRSPLGLHQQVYLETYGVGKPRRLVNLTESFDVEA